MVAFISWVNEISPSENRADVMSIFYAISYLGAGIPVLALGIGTERIGFHWSISFYSALIIALSALVAFIIRTYHAKAS